MKKLNQSYGFTLIEIMITVAIVGILASIAYGSYSSSVEKSRRTDAKDALSQAAVKQERFYLRNNVYTNTITNIGGASSQEGYYTIAVDNTQTLAGACDNAGECYRLTATANNPGAQAGDTDCRTLRIDSVGRRNSLSAGNVDTTATCW